MKKDEYKDKHQARELHDHLARQFGELKPDASVPETLKEDVFNALDSMQLMADIADLFTVKFTSSELQMLDLMDNGQENGKDSE